MSDPAWKKREREVSKKMQKVEPEARRNPLSGRSSGHGTSSDVLSKRFYIEVKWRKGFAHHTLYREVKEVNKKEGGSKIPIVVTHEKGRHGDLVIIALDDFINLAETKYREDTNCV